MADDLPKHGDKLYPLRINPDGSATETQPEHCPNGHPLGPDNLRRSWTPCHDTCSARGHRTWTCSACHATIHDPPHTGPDYVERWGMHSSDQPSGQ